MVKAEYTQGSIAKLMLTTAVAMLASTLAMSGYNIADTFFVGHLGGEEPLAAMGFTFPVVMFVGCIFHGFGTGCMTTMAHAVGREDMKEASRLVTGGLQLLVIIAFIMALIGIGTADYAFGKMGAKGLTLELVKQYMNIWFIGCVTSGLSMEGNKLLISAGKPRIASSMTILGMVINVILDPIFIFGGELCHKHVLANTATVFHSVLDPFFSMLHFMPAMGIRGAAYATVISQVVSALVILLILHKVGLLFFRPLPIAKLVSTGKIILSYGIPAILGMLLFPISNYITTWVTAKFGDTAVAGVAAASKLEMVAFVFPMAFGIPLMPMIAQNYGAGLYSRVKGCFKFAVTVALCFLSAIAVLLFLFGHNIVVYFTPVPAVQEVMIRYMRIIPFGFAMLEITRFAGFALIGCGHPVQDTVLKAIRILGIMVPLYLLTWLIHWYDGIFVSRLLTDLLGGAICVSFAWRMLSKLPEDTPKK